MEENNVVEEVLTREKGLKESILPTGRKVGAVPVRGGSMYRIKFVDGKQGDVPGEYQGHYTGLMGALRAVDEYVKSFWDLSDAAAAKQRKPLSLNNNAVSR